MWKFHVEGSKQISLDYKQLLIGKLEKKVNQYSNHYYKSNEPNLNEFIPSDLFGCNPHRLSWVDTNAKLHDDLTFHIG